MLTPSIAFTLTLATAFVALRYGGYPRWFGFITAALSLGILALALADWYGPGNLAPAIMALSLGWLAVTSALTIPAYEPADWIRGTR